MKNVKALVQSRQQREREQSVTASFDATLQPRILQAVAAIRAAKERLMMSEEHLQMQQKVFTAAVNAEAER